MKKILATVTLLLSTAVPQAISAPNMPEANLTNEDYVRHPIIAKTESRFEERKIIIVEPIPYPKEFQDDPEMELDTNRILQKGQEGKKIKTFKVLYWSGKEVDRILDQVEIEEPVTEIISRGTKIVWRDYYTPDVGVISYWRKLTVWATSYDANCLGCTGRTFTGTDVHVGVCAVDPRVIRLGTTFYVPGYGLCHAEDIGGMIKGNDVDLGFEDVRQGWWGARYVDIYIMDNPFIAEEAGQLTS